MLEVSSFHVMFLIFYVAFLCNLSELQINNNFMLLLFKKGGRIGKIKAEIQEQKKATQKQEKLLDILKKQKKSQQKT